VKFADGSIGNFLYTTVGSDASAGELVEVFAAGVGASVEDFKSVTVKKKQRKTQKNYFADKGYVEQMESFIGNLRAGKPPLVTAIDGARATILCLLMIESAKRGSPIDFDLAEILEQGI
jgi:hypothetical protein